jgi:hypothetical protein
MEPVIVEYDFKQNGKTEHVKREIEFPEEPMRSLFAGAQPGFDISWCEKMALKKRIEELERDVIYLRLKTASLKSKLNGR